MGEMQVRRNTLECFDGEEDVPDWAVVDHTTGLLCLHGSERRARRCLNQRAESSMCITERERIQRRNRSGRGLHKRSDAPLHEGIERVAFVRLTFRIPRNLEWLGPDGVGTLISGFSYREACAKRPTVECRSRKGFAIVFVAADRADDLVAELVAIGVRP